MALYISYFMSKNSTLMPIVSYSTINKVCIFIMSMWRHYSELSDISHKSVKVMCAELLFVGKWPPMEAIFPQKAAPHTSLSHYNIR